MHWQRAGPGSAYCRQPSLQLTSVGVRAVAVENLHTRAKRNVLAEDGEGGSPLDDSAAECVFRLEADDQDRIPGIGRAVREMMENSSVLHHAGFRPFWVCASPPMHRLSITYLERTAAGTPTLFMHKVMRILHDFCP